MVEIAVQLVSIFIALLLGKVGAVDPPTQSLDMMETVMTVLVDVEFAMVP